MSAPSFTAALDIGGTHARLAVHPQGQPVRFFHAPGFTLAQNGLRDTFLRCRALLRLGLGTLGLSPHMCAALCCGAAGVDSEKGRRLYRRILCRLGFPAQSVHVWNDCELPLAEQAEPSVLIACGTGSIVLARGADGRIARCGGWGFLTSDEGSACRLALDGLACAARFWDGAENAPVLAGLLQEQLGLHSGAQAEAFARRFLAQKHRLGALAPLVCQAAQAGEGPAVCILGRHARALAQSARAAADRAGLSRPPVLLWGSLLTETDALAVPLTRALEQAGFSRVQPLRSSALECGLRLAERLRQEVRLCI